MGDIAYGRTDETPYRAMEARIERLERLLGHVIQTLDDREAETVNADGDDIPFDEWLADWKAEEPDVFLSGEDLRQQIACYEEKYGMSSSELLQRVQDGTAPDSNEIMDWKMLLEWLK